MIKKCLNSLLLLLVLSGVFQAQQTPSPVPTETRTPNSQSSATTQKVEEVGEGEVLRITSNLVVVPVSVVDREGRYVVDLHQSDFRIYENGAEQTIAHFGNVDQPFSAVLLIDTSESTTPFLAAIKDAAKAFVDQLRPADKVHLIHFHGEVKRLTQAGVSDHALLDAAIDRMEPGPWDMGTRLYDAVDLSLRELKREFRRTAVILLTDGENTWGKATMKGTLHDAEESDSVFYTVQFGNPVQKYLQQLAEKTGGRYFKADDINLIKKSFISVAEELRRQYLIGFYAEGFSQALTERKLKVKVNRKNVAVRARGSYRYSR